MPYQWMWRCCGCCAVESRSDVWFLSSACTWSTSQWIVQLGSWLVRGKEWGEGGKRRLRPCGDLMETSERWEKAVQEHGALLAGSNLSDARDGPGSSELTEEKLSVPSWATKAGGVRAADGANEQVWLLESMTWQGCCSIVHLPPFLASFCICSSLKGRWPWCSSGWRTPGRRRRTWCCGLCSCGSKISCSWEHSSFWSLNSSVLFVLLYFSSQIPEQPSTLMDNFILLSQKLKDTEKCWFCLLWSLTVCTLIKIPFMFLFKHQPKVSYTDKAYPLIEIHKACVINPVCRQ